MKKVKPVGILMSQRHAASERIVERDHPAHKALVGQVDFDNVEIGPYLVRHCCQLVVHAPVQLVRLLGVILIGAVLQRQRHNHIALARL